MVLDSRCPMTQALEISSLDYASLLYGVYIECSLAIEPLATNKSFVCIASKRLNGNVR